MAKFVFRFFQNPLRLISFILQWYCPRLIHNDELYLKIVYFCKYRKRLNIKNPRTFTEKLQWLKLHDRNPLYTIMADKVLAKDYVAKKIGDECIIPTIGIWNSPEEIDFEKLPNQFVIKCNHNSGMGMLICKDKGGLSEAVWRNELKDLRRGLKQNFFYPAREWPYKNIKRRILAEEFMSTKDSPELCDYKFHCFNGVPRLIDVVFDRAHHHRNYYDISWNLLSYGDSMYPPVPDKVIERPINFEKMLEVAEILSKDIPYSRIDLYNIDGKIYFGEITFFHFGGYAEFTEPYADELLGSYLTLPIQLKEKE